MIREEKPVEPGRDSIVYLVEVGAFYALASAGACLGIFGFKWLAAGLWIGALGLVTWITSRHHFFEKSGESRRVKEVRSVSFRYVIITMRSESIPVVFAIIFALLLITSVLISIVVNWETIAAR